MDRILGFSSPFVISYKLIMLLSLLDTQTDTNFMDAVQLVLSNAFTIYASEKLIGSSNAR